MAWLKFQNISSKTISDLWVPSKHSDPYWRIYWNRDLGAKVFFDDQVISLLPEYIYILPAWMIWKGELENPVEHTWANFRTHQWNKAVCRNWFPRPVQISLDSPRGACMLEIFERFRKEKELPEVEGEALAHLALGETMNTFPMPSSSNPLLHKVLSYIQEHLDGDLRVANLAKVQGCSAGHLSRLFQEQLGASPSQVVRESRISFAADRLLESHESMEHIAEASGFSNRFHFSRVFREVMHMAPAAFRKHHWGSWS
jgi:AraC-like DNA-binding protein